MGSDCRCIVVPPHTPTPTSWGGNEVISIGGGGDIHYSDIEHSCAIYCNAADHGDVWSGRATSGNAGLEVVVISGRVKPVWFVVGDGNVSRDGGGGWIGGVGIYG